MVTPDLAEISVKNLVLPPCREDVGVVRERDEEVRLVVVAFQAGRLAGTGLGLPCRMLVVPGLDPHDSARLGCRPHSQCNVEGGAVTGVFVASTRW